MTAVLVPGAPTAGFADLLRLTKRELLDVAGEAGRVFQTGAVYVGDEISFPTDTASFVAEDALIETFVVGADGALMATGMDADFIAAWTPTAERFAAAVRTSLRELDVELAGDAYLTVSSTPGDQVEGECHFDDDQFDPDDGVGVVAIVGDIDGPRIACSPLEHGPATASLPLPVDDEVLAQFDGGGLAIQHAEAHRVVLFPQFAQLHAGPALSETDPSAVRNLMVFRARTKPSTTP